MIWRPLQGVDVGVEVLDPDPGLGQVVGQVLRHFFGQGGDQDLVFAVGLPADLADQVVDLALDGADVDLGIQKAGRPDDLLGPEQLVLLLVGAGRRGDKEHLVDVGLELRELQGPVVQGRGQAEAVADQGLLAGPVAAVHGPDLGDGHVGLVDDDEKIVVVEVHEGHGRLALLHEVQVAGVVLDAGAEAGLPHHLDVEIGALGDALGLQEHVLALEIFDALAQLLLDVVAGGIDLLLRDHIMGGRIDHDVLQLAVDPAGQLVDLADAVDLVAEPLDAEDELTPLGGKDLQGVAPDPEIAAVQGHVIARILNGHQLLQDLVPVLLHARAGGRWTCP